MTALLTTREAADLLDVHESTVKRWCNADELRHLATRGGHRRIGVADLMAFARAQGLQSPLLDFHPFEAEVWEGLKSARGRGDYRPLSSLSLEWALTDRPHLIEALFRLLGGRGIVPTGRMFDELLGTLMRSVGEAWRQGKIGVGEEHFSTQIVMDALHQMRAFLHASHPVYRDPARRQQLAQAAVVACAEGEQHELGAMCVRILLEEHNWRVYYLGANVPIEEVAAFQKKQGAELVALSFVPPRAPSDAQRTVRLLAEMYDARTPYALALGGSGLAGEAAAFGQIPFLELKTFDRLADFEPWADRRFRNERTSDGGSR